MGLVEKNNRTSEAGHAENGGRCAGLFEPLTGPWCVKPVSTKRALRRLLHIRKQSGAVRAMVLSMAADC